MTGLYVFALAGQPLSAVTIAGHRIESVASDASYAAVTRLKVPPPVTEATLRRQHDVVADLVDRVESLLPARFGAFMGRAELLAVMATRRDAIREALALVRNRRQMTLRLFEPDALASGGSAGRAASSGAAYLEARRAAAAIPAALRAAGDVLEPLVRAERAEPARGKTGATLYHLIDCDAADRYAGELAAFLSRSPAAIAVSGPWPPFAFAPDLWT